MSLPREWSSSGRRGEQVEFFVGTLPTPGSLEDASVVTPAASQDAVQEAGLIDENMNKHHHQQHQDLLGSLFSIHSAPVFDVSGGEHAGSNLPKSHYHHEHFRPASLAVQATATSTPMVVPPQHLSPPDTLEDEENDNQFTISSLTARPLIAKSRELKRTSTKKKDEAKKKKKKKKKKKNRNNLEPLDGGYGWVVVFGAFFVQFWVAGLVKSYGVLYVEVMETFTDSSASVASWIPAILSCLCLALAPITSMLSQKYSCRRVVFVGGLFCSLGLITSYFSTSLVHLLFTFGVLTGIGGGLSTTPGIILVSQYFDTHRALANGICVSGTAAGSFVFPMLIEFLVANFGFHGTLLILGGCMLHVCVSASLYRPLEKNYEEEDEDDEPKKEPLENEAARHKLEMLFAHDQTAKNNMLNELFHQNTHANELAINLTDSEEEKDILGESLRLKPISKIRSSSLLHSVEDLSTDSTCFYKSRSSQRSLRSSALAVGGAGAGQLDSTERLPSTAIITRSQPHLQPIPPSRTPTHEQTASKESLSQRIISRYIDLGLLRDARFIMMCLSVTLMSTGSPYMLYFLPAYVHQGGYTKTEAGYLVAISAAFDLCGRLGLGWLSDLQLFDRRKTYIGSIVGAGIAVLVIPVANSFYILSCSVAIYGLCLGSWFLLVPVLLADQYGTEKISSTYGLVRMFQSIGAITIPPFAGYMRDVTGSYNVCFLFMGTCMVLGGLPLLLVSNDDTKNKDKPKDTDTTKEIVVMTPTKA